MQNLPDCLIGKPESFANLQINLQKRHGSGEFVESLPDEFVPEDGGGSHRGRPFFL